MNTVVLFGVANIITLAQTPNAIPYQAVARNSSGNLIASQNMF